MLQRRRSAEGPCGHVRTEGGDSPLADQLKHFRQGGEHSGGSQFLPGDFGSRDAASPSCGKRRRTPWRGKRLRRHVNGFQRRLDRRRGRKLMIDREHALHEVEREPGYAGNRGELFSDERLFHWAIHIHNAVYGPRGRGFAQRRGINLLRGGMGMTATAALRMGVRMLPMRMMIVIATGRVDMGFRKTFMISRRLRTVRSRLPAGLPRLFAYEPHGVTISTGAQDQSIAAHRVPPENIFAESLPPSTPCILPIGWRRMGKAVVSFHVQTIGSIVPIGSRKISGCDLIRVSPHENAVRAKRRNRGLPP